MAVVAVVAVVNPHQPSRSLGCCSYHAWQAEGWVAGRFRLRYRYRYRYRFRFRYRYYRCHHREES